MGDQPNVATDPVMIVRGAKRFALVPIPMILFCPACGLQHVDAPEPEHGWNNPPHRSHRCARCLHIWRPALVETTGVAELSGPLGEHDSRPPIRGEGELAVEELRLAIRKHRDATTGHGMCWEHDRDLWAVLDEEDPTDHTPPPPEEFMARCAEYCASRQGRTP